MKLSFSYVTYLFVKLYVGKRLFTGGLDTDWDFPDVKIFYPRARDLLASKCLSRQALPVQCLSIFYRLMKLMNITREMKPVAVIAKRAFWAILIEVKVFILSSFRVHE
jgi:hypothetical protein